MSRPEKRELRNAPDGRDERLPSDLSKLAEALGYYVAFQIINEPFARSTAMMEIQSYSPKYSRSEWRVLRHLWFVECSTLIAENVYKHETDFLIETDEARLSVGPTLARGCSKDQAIAIATKRAPHVSAAHIALIVDEEAAWWIRCRHERGYLRTEMAA